MKKITLIMMAMVNIGVHYGQKTNDGSIPWQSVFQKTDDLVKAYYDLDIFSGVVLISSEGNPIYHKAFGLANRENNTPNTLQTRFVIGSMNKSFTHVIIMQLIHAGKIRYEDKMVQYIDGFVQPHADKITIRQLLTHQSGLGDYHSPEFFALPYHKKNIEGILNLVKTMPLLFEPGSDNHYSNAGYVVLGAIIEKLTGKSYADNVEERIAHPLEMNSLVTRNIRQTDNRATGYMKTYKGVLDNEEFVFEPKPDGGCFATAEDMMHFYREYFYGKKLVPEQIKIQDDFYNGIKPILQEKGRGLPLAGGFNGANTVHLEMPADNISIVVFANMDEPVAEKIAIGILRIINGQQPDEPALPTLLNVYTAYKEHGIGYVQSNFETLTRNWFDGDPKDLILNNLGYQLLRDGQLSAASEILKLNTELFPQIANCWDSYGEALAKSGKKNEAIAAYRKALSIRPNLPSAVEALKKLEQ